MISRFLEQIDHKSFNVIKSLKLYSKRRCNVTVRGPRFFSEFHFYLQLQVQWYSNARRSIIAIPSAMISKCVSERQVLTLHSVSLSEPFVSTSPHAHFRQVSLYSDICTYTSVCVSEEQMLTTKPYLLRLK